MTGSIIEIGMRQRMRRIFIAALAVEFALLALFAAAGGALIVSFQAEAASPAWSTYALIAVVAFAMGAQNTSLRMAGILSVFTTHMTGAITGLSEEIIVCAFSLCQPRNRRTRGGFAAESLRQRHPQAFKNIGRSTALIVGFFIGAFAGASLARAVGLSGAMVVPLALLIAVGIVDWIVPLTVFPAPVEQE